MTFFDVLSLVGGLALFLFGMNLMGSSLQKRAGNKLKPILGSMTSNTFKGFLLGLAVTAVIQSSSATTVMVVGFVNSGIMTLGQSVGVIMGANLGASVTSWLISLTDLEGDAFIVQIFKPSSFVPVLAFVGILLYMFQKNPKRKDTGLILLGFAVLMYGMEFMSGSVAGLKDDPNFTRILTLFSNPILGVIVGAVVTAIIQSSAASVGILQALSSTGAITHSAAIPIIMGQNIGTCISALISCIGTSKNAKRAAVIHLSFNVIATLILLPAYYILDSLIHFSFSGTSSTAFSIAVVHTVFKIIALVILMPCSSLLEKLAKLVIRDAKEEGPTQLLDERILATPSVAIIRGKQVTVSMAELAVSSVKKSFTLLSSYDAKKIEEIDAEEDEVDMYEDKIGTFLVKLSSHNLSEQDNAEVNTMLHLIGDFERISDHAVNLAESCDEINDKKLAFSEEAKSEIDVLVHAVSEILDLSMAAFRDGDLLAASKVEPLEQVVDHVKDEIRKQHVSRLQKQECNMEMGFILSDVLTNLERISDHCSNVAGCLLEMTHEGLDIHEYLRSVKGGEVEDFNENFNRYMEKYHI